jgi:hypothetical protein
VDSPLPGGILVVEGWSSDYTIKEAIPEFRRRPYEGVFVTGGPLDRGSPLLQYKTYAELAAATLARMGMPQEVIRAVPAPDVIRDRTFASAVALKQWLREHGIAAKQINILGSGAHSRRTRLVYERAFGNEAAIGVVATPEMNFNPDRWWTSSEGFRTVIDEMIGYTYARLLFSPQNESQSPMAAAPEKQ